MDFSAAGFTEDTVAPDAGDKHLRPRFFLSPVLDIPASEAAGRRVYRDVPHVAIRIPGDADEYVQPVWDDPSHPRSHVSRFPEAWAAFKAGQSEAVVGTRLEDWPGVGRAMVEELKHHRLFTVESLAALPDGNAQRIPQGLALKAKAQAFLERAAQTKPLEEVRRELESRDAAIAALQAQLKQVLEAQAAQQKQQAKK